VPQEKNGFAKRNLAGGVFFSTPMFTRVSNQTVLVCTQFDVARPDANCKASVNKIAKEIATPLKNIILFTLVNLQLYDHIPLW